MEKISKMNASDICVRIKNNEILDFSQNQLNNSNRMLTVIDIWEPPFVYENVNEICGPLIKIAEQFCKVYGYK